MIEDFKLPDAFVEKYATVSPEFGFNGLGEMVYMRTYSRFKPDGTKEQWHETIRRVVEWVFDTQKKHIESMSLGWSNRKAINSAKEMFDRMFYMKFLPPGRGLWIAGTKVLEYGNVAAALNNCFSGDTKFITDKGTRSLSEMAGLDCNVLSKDGKFRKAEIKSFGVQTLDRIFLKPHGLRTNHKVDILATENHRWILRDGSITTNLSENDVLNESVEAFVPVDNEGFLHGLIYGDGTKHTYYPDRQFIRLCGEKAKHLHVIENLPGYKSTTYPESFGGDPVVTYVRKDVNFKRLPLENSSISYTKSFIDGWCAADAWTKPNGSICLDTQKIEDVDWLKDNSFLAGYSITGLNVATNDTNFGVRSNPLNRISMSRKPLQYKVVEIVKKVTVEQVYCAVEPVTKSFTLASGVLTGNCAYVATDNLAKDPSKPFRFMMDMSMLGVGVGFGLEGANTIKIKKPKTVSGEHLIPDSREGWVAAFGVLLNAYLLGDNIPKKYNYSQIRKKGLPIKGFGGTASGPEPLADLFASVKSQLENREGEFLTEEDIADIMNKIGVCVVAGNVRRTAQIILGSPYSNDFKELKSYSYDAKSLSYVGPKAHRAKYGWASNNSVLAELGMDYTDIAKRINTNGEPGLVWMDNARDYSLMSDAPDYKDHKAVGTNPCFTGDMKLKTSAGYKTFRQLSGYKDLDLVNMYGEVVKGDVWSNGVKGVVYVKAGSTKDPIIIKCTPDHRFLVSGEEVEAKDLQGKRLTPQVSYKTDFSSELHKLGFIQGDGSLRKDRTKGRHIHVECCFTPGKDSDVLELFGLVENNKKTKTTDIKYSSLELLEFDFSHRNERDVPQGIGTDTYADFLSGLFSANGSVISTGGRVALKTASKKERDSVIHMLNILGIDSYYTTNRPKDIEWENGTYTSRESYDINISRLNSIVKFAEEISFIQSYKRDSLMKLIESKSPYVFSVFDNGVEEEVYDFRLHDDTHWGVVEGVIAHNCGEQTLESYELCCLVETFPTRNKDREDYNRTLKFAYLYAKTVTLCNTHWAETNRVMLRNRRIGTSMSGIAQFYDTKGIGELKKYCDSGYKTIAKMDNVYSDWLCVPRSIKTTSIKPSGTVSLLAGCTPGIHFPESKYYIRRMRIAKDSPMIGPLQEAGYNVVDAHEDSFSKVIEIPVHVEGVRELKNVSMWEQLSLAAFMQENWADNQVSATITFDPKTEGNKIAKALNFFQYKLKGVSFLPKTEAGVYRQMPYEEISKDMFCKLNGAITTINWGGRGDKAIGERFCDGDSCVV